ncbi:MAG: DUF3800 domain-containing protein [Bacteroidia bacterium]
MKKAEAKPSANYFFVDESGDPNFYDAKGNFIVGQDGCSKILLLGFINVPEPESIRKMVASLKEDIAKDAYLSSIPSVQKSIRAFHAKDDCPEVRERFFKEIVKMNFKAEFVVARKREDIFKSRHRSNENVFYDDLISKLFENQLHKALQSVIYFATRGNRNRTGNLANAIQTAKLTFENKWKIQIESDINILSQNTIGEPCLQVIDYMNWAVQRAFIRGEDRYLKFVESKISLIIDIYDFKKYPSNYYNRKNKFELKKISPL